MSTIYLDLEVLDCFQDPHIAKLPRFRQLAAMRFGLATTYAEPLGMVTWWPEQIGDLWERLTSCSRIVGWNSDEFDIPYLIVQAVRLRLTHDPWGELPPTLDLMDLIKRETKRLDGKERWYKLDVIAWHNLGRNKISSGDEAAAWLRSGERALIQKAADYCKDDVQLVIDLHRKLLAGEPLICPARPDRREYQEVRVYLLQEQEQEHGRARARP
jgi:hypothetical protein